MSSLRTQILEWPSDRASYYFKSSRCRRTAFLRAPFSILGTSKSLRELCRDCTEAGEAVQSCVSPKIAAQGSMNALARYRSEEASHRLTRNAVVFFSRHHTIFLELQCNILCSSSDLLEQIRSAQRPHNRKKYSALPWHGSDFDVPFLNRLYHSFICVMPILLCTKAFCIISIVSVQLLPRLKQNLMQIRWSVLSVISNCKQMRRTEKARWT